MTRDPYTALAARCAANALGKLVVVILAVVVATSCGWCSVRAAEEVTDACGEACR